MSLFPRKCKFGCLFRVVCGVVNRVVFGVGVIGYSTKRGLACEQAPVGDSRVQSTANEMNR